MILLSRKYFLYFFTWFRYDLVSPFSQKSTFRDFNKASDAKRFELSSSESDSLVARNVKDATFYLRAFELLIRDEVNPITLFLPSDSAFSKLFPLSFDEHDDSLILNNSKLLYEIISYHIVSAESVSSDQIKRPKLFKTKNGNFVLLNKDVNETLYVNDARAIEVDKLYDSGIYHVIDKVLIPKNVDIKKMAVLQEKGIH